jgi:hypothetical protein
MSSMSVQWPDVAAGLLAKPTRRTEKLDAPTFRG